MREQSGHVHLPATVRETQAYYPRIALLGDYETPVTASAADSHRSLITFHSIPEIREALEQEAFDILVLDSASVSHELIIDMLYWTKVIYFEPCSIILMQEANSELILDSYRAGAFRVIVKQGYWQDEYIQALEQATRFKKIQEENTLMHAKLTETNALLQEQNRRL